MGCFRVPKPEL